MSTPADKQAARFRAVMWAREALGHPMTMFLDTETTGTGEDASIIEISLLDRDGTTLYDGLVYPASGGSIPAEASAVHGITDRDVVNAPTWYEVAPLIREYIGSGHQVVIYNAEFDLRLIHQDNLRVGISPYPVRAMCAMLAYAEYAGEWNVARQSYGWHSLDNAYAATVPDWWGPAPEPAHRARADAEKTRQLVQAMAYRVGINGISPRDIEWAQRRDDVTREIDRIISGFSRTLRAQLHEIASMREYDAEMVAAWMSEMERSGTARGVLDYLPEDLGAYAALAWDRDRHGKTVGERVRGETE